MDMSWWRHVMSWRHVMTSWHVVIMSWWQVMTSRQHGDVTVTSWWQPVVTMTSGRHGDVMAWPWHGRDMPWYVHTFLKNIWKTCFLGYPKCAHLVVVTSRVHHGDSRALPRDMAMTSRGSARASWWLSKMSLWGLMISWQTEKTCFSYVFRKSMDLHRRDNFSISWQVCDITTTVTMTSCDVMMTM